MKLSELLRNKIFWSIDAIKRGPKKKYFNEIKFINENPNLKEAIDIKKQRLTSLLNHATTTSTYYNSFRNFSSITDFPVINKNVIKAHISDFQSEKFLKAENKEVLTSGSTGSPFKAYHNNLKTTRSIADNLYFSEQAGFKLGYLITYFRMWKAFEQKGTLVKLLQNVQPVDVFDLQNEKTIASVLNDLKKSAASNSWLGYASAFEMICKYLDKENIKPMSNKLYSAIAISESLNDYTRQKMKSIFNVNVVSRYSNVENGIIAQQPLGKHYFIINEASYLVEVLDVDKDIPIEDGKLGRIVVTDLYNYAMPMIRYDTGDLGVKNCVGGKLVLENIYGRKIDVIYDTLGRPIHVNLILLVNNYPDLKQCQLIQKAKGVYHLKLNATGIFKKVEKFISDLKHYLGSDAVITIDYVDEIPLLNSGKRRVMVNEMQKIN